MLPRLAPFLCRRPTRVGAISVNAVDNLYAVVEGSGVLVRGYQGLEDGFAEIFGFPVLISPASFR